MVYPVIFMEGEFATGTARYWTGYGSIPWNGQTWVGLGNLVALSPIDEGTAISARGFSVSLNGQSQADLALALGACRQGAPGRFWFGTLDAAGAVIADPYLIRRGRLDVASGSESGEEAVITVGYEDRLIDLERPREFRYTTESQRLFHLADLGFAFVPSLQDAVDVWKP